MSSQNDLNPRDDATKRALRFQKFLSSFLFEFIPHRTKFPASRSEHRKKKKKKEKENNHTRKSRGGRFDRQETMSKFAAKVESSRTNSRRRNLKFLSRG